VEIEVEFVEWNRQDLLNYGLSLPTSFPIVNLNAVTPLSALGSLNMFGIALGNVQVIANMTQSRPHTLLHSELRAVDGQAASMHVGDKYPILTSGYFGPQSVTSGTGGTGGSAPFGSGDGAVSFTVAANTDATPRTGTITVADQTFTITQPGAGG